jgi:hypothetical protein
MDEEERVNHQPRLDRAAPRIALVTCAQVPELDADSRRLLGPLEARGVAAEPKVWDDPTVDWAGFDLAVVRSCWDYVPRRAEFLAWAQRMPWLANPPEMLAWNTDKRYLRELAAAGVPVVPTTWVQPHQAWTLPERGEWVLKPAVSLAALDTGRYQLGDAWERRLAVQHLRRLQTTGRMVMAQPYLRAVDTEGRPRWCTWAAGSATRSARGRCWTAPTPVSTGGFSTTAGWTCDPAGRVRRSGRSPSGCWSPCRAGPAGCCMPASTWRLGRTGGRC